MALAAEDGNDAQSSGIDPSLVHAVARDHELDATAEHVVQRRPATAIRHMHEIDTGLAAQHLEADVIDRAAGS